MPTYQYSCTDCGHFFEAVQSFSDDSLTVCPECAGKLRKVYNAVGVVFKGSGFYRTDSRAAAGSGEGSGSSSEKSAGNGSGTSPGKGAGSTDAGSSTKKEPSSAGSSSGSAGSSGSSAKSA